MYDYFTSEYSINLAKICRDYDVVVHHNLGLNKMSPVSTFSNLALAPYVQVFTRFNLSILFLYLGQFHFIFLLLGLNRFYWQVCTSLTCLIIKYLYVCIYVCTYNPIIFILFFVTLFSHLNEFFMTNMLA